MDQKRKNGQNGQNGQKRGQKRAKTGQPELTPFPILEKGGRAPLSSLFREYCDSRRDAWTQAVGAVGPARCRFESTSGGETGGSRLRRIHRAGGREIRAEGPGNRGARAKSAKSEMGTEQLCLLFQYWTRGKFRLTRFLGAMEEMQFTRGGGRPSGLPLRRGGRGGSRWPGRLGQDGYGRHDRWSVVGGDAE